MIMGKSKLLAMLFCLLFCAIDMHAQFGLFVTQAGPQKEKKVKRVEFDAKNDAGIPIRYEVISDAERKVAVTGGAKFYFGVRELIIPEFVDYNGATYTVTEIGTKAFGNLVWSGPKIETVVLPSTIIKIGDEAFAFCRSLVSVNLSEGLIEIGNNAFCGSYKLENLYIPNSVRKIGKNAFKGCVSGEVENLPTFVTADNCSKMGLSRESVETYWAYHPQTALASQPQQQIVNVREPIQQPEVTPEQSKTPSSDVDIDIPIGTANNGNTFAVIFANENYSREAQVDFAKNDGTVFKSYCHLTLGLPEKNVHFVANATLNDLIGELDWLRQVCDAYGGEANIIFYYAGHGIPDEASSSAYLLPTDGNSRILRTCFSVNELYETLGRLFAKQVTVLMDACFSGAKRDGQMLASARGVAIKAKAGMPKGNMIVLSASQGDETAYKYEEAGHGLFTYFLLKKLKETKGAVTMGELSRYIQEQVKRYSIVENGKIQTPSVQTSDTLEDKWESLRLE
jgi:hypothetical protein